MAERGLTTKAVLLSGMADYAKYFGTRQSYGYLYDTVKLYFDEGGVQCYVARVVGSTATKGTVTLDDTGGAPAATVKVDALSAGSWSSHVKVTVAAGTIANTVKVTVALADNSVVEYFDNLATPAAIVTAFQNSSLVAMTDMGSATAAPANLPATGTFSLSAGTDDRADLTASDYTAALALFTPDLGDGAVAIPGMGTAVHAGLVTHAAANNRIALLSHTSAATQSDLTTAAAAVTAVANAEYAGLFAPWVQVSDGGLGIYTIPPEGYVAAVRARAIDAAGPWRAPAGQIAVADTITGLTTYYDSTTGNSLDGAGVSVIRRIANSIRLYGWRSLSGDAINYQFLSARDVLNDLAVQAVAELEQYVFAPIDAKGQLLSKVAGSLIGIAKPLADAGGLYAMYDSNGRLVDPGYKVDTGPSVNSVISLGNNQVNARLSVRVSPTGATINVNITKVGFSSGM
jgi:hypothetical protein